jgi:hypothetical protein
MGWAAVARCVVAIAVVATSSACSIVASDSGPSGTTEAATIVVRDDSLPICNVELSEPERHGRFWYTKATVSPDEHPPGEVRGELRYETDETALFAGDGVEVWFGSYEYWEISDEPGARGPRFPTADCPITTRSGQWRPPPGGV